MGLDMYLTAKRNNEEKEVAYWRKANQIHKWFVEHVQNGNDMCKTYKVSREQLRELVNVCEKVLLLSKLRQGLVQNGSCLTDKGWEKIMEDGRIIEDPTTAIELLPTIDGFFFGDTNYDERYCLQLKKTIEQIIKALKLDKSWFFYYQSSW